MTFAEELRHAISVEPVLEAPEPPEPNANETEWRIWMEACTPKERDPGSVRVLEVSAGFNDLLAVCQAKEIFARPMWTEMHFLGADSEQLREFIDRKCPDYNEAALWTQGTYFRLLVRTHPTIAYSALSVGSGMTEENRQETYRALWDVGIRELRNHARPDNPHTATMQKMGHFEFVPDASGRYLYGRRVFTERP